MPSDSRRRIGPLRLVRLSRGRSRAARSAASRKAVLVRGNVRSAEPAANQSIRVWPRGRLVAALYRRAGTLAGGIEAAPAGGPRSRVSRAEAALRARLQPALGLLPAQSGADASVEQVAD